MARFSTARLSSLGGFGATLVALSLLLLASSDTALGKPGAPEPRKQPAKPAAAPASKPAAKPASSPASKPTAKPASGPASKPTAKPARRRSTKGDEPGHGAGAGDEPGAGAGHARKPGAKAALTNVERMSQGLKYLTAINLILGRLAKMIEKARKADDNLRVTCLYRFRGMIKSHFDSCSALLRGMRSQIVLVRATRKALPAKQRDIVKRFDRISARHAKVIKLGRDAQACIGATTVAADIPRFHPVKPTPKHGKREFREPLPVAPPLASPANP